MMEEFTIVSKPDKKSTHVVTIKYLEPPGGILQFELCDIGARANLPNILRDIAAHVERALDLGL